MCMICGVFEWLTLDGDGQVLVDGRRGVPGDHLVGEEDWRLGTRGITR